MTIGKKDIALILFALSITAHGLLVSCGYKGEEIKPNTAATQDTVVNDLSYTAVTGNVSTLSAVGVRLNGYANIDVHTSSAGTEQGFLISRFSENPSYAASDLYEPNTENYVRRVPVDSIANDNSITARVYGLIPNTTFYFRTYVIKNGEALHGVVRPFMTGDLTASITTPQNKVDFSSVTVSGKITGLAGDNAGANKKDYGHSVTLNFRCQNVPYTSDTIGTFYKEADSYEENSTDYRYSVINDLTPGERYYVQAYADLQSDFYVYEKDNPTTDTLGNRIYGRNAEDILTHKYVSKTLEFNSLDLSGVVVYNTKDVAVDYDVAEITDAYFVLPSDTLSATEYGVALITSDEYGNTVYDYHPSTDELRTGKRYSVTITDLPLKTSYKYVSYVIVKRITFYSNDILTFSTQDYTPGEVDLGLPSGRIWADRNIGSYSPETYGHYYAWGETSTKKTYTDENYTGDTYTKNIVQTDGDAAHVKWGDDWRMPTREDFQELYYECEWKWTKINGISGVKVISLVNDHYIFLPATGLKKDDTAEEQGKFCRYWTGERELSQQREYGMGYNMYYAEGFPKDSLLPDNTVLPSYGLAIRPVYDKQ